jgi:hypothetical protein
MLGQDYHKETYTDTTEREAKRLARRYRVADRVSMVHTYAKNVIYIEQILRNPGSIASFKADMIVFELGSNELARMPDGLTKERIFITANYCKTVSACFNPRSICVFMGVLPRLGKIQCSPESFRQYAKWYNDFLREFARETENGSYPPNFRFHHMQGWAMMKDRSGRDVERPATDWLGHDMIHPHKMVFLDKYAHTLRSAILDPKNLPTC